MLYKARNGRIPFRDGDMHYVRFGRGKRILIMLPGLGDGLRSVEGAALPLAFMYREFGKSHTVYVFSRKSCIPQGYTTRDMARDQRKAMEALGIRQADVLGVSMGGMIAQHLAADAPDMVRRLLLVATSAQPNPVLTESVTEWISFAERGDYLALLDSNVRRIYTEKYYRKNQWAIPVVEKISRPKSYDHFLIQAQACLTHDAAARLPMIQVPTLVIGGEQDRALGGEASRQIAAGIPRARLWMYPEYGHGLYEEAKNFQDLVLAFLKG